MKAVLFSLLALVQSMSFPALPAQSVAMTAIHNATITNAERTQIMAIPTRDTRPDRCRYPIYVAVPVLSTGKRTFIVSGCQGSATGNDFFWILIERAAGIESLGVSSFVHQVYVLRSATAGFRDLVVTTHESFDLSDLRLVRFDGKRYKVSRCAERYYKSSAAPPKISAASCSDLGNYPGK